MISQETRQECLRRLHYIRGHLDGIARMLEDTDAHCTELLTQLRAVESAVRQVGERILLSHLRGCVLEAARQGEGEAFVEELAKVLKLR